MADTKGIKYDTSKEEASTDKKSKVYSDTTLYEKPLKAKAIQDKTGWEVREENKAIFKSKGK